MSFKIPILNENKNLNLSNLNLTMSDELAEDSKGSRTFHIELYSTWNESRSDRCFHIRLS
ncbi:CLUMA_CG018462, isoform A [Clunio marinus]|uniref:CLUMA_CG018462, isoform A n=1 Tax=Clunio marinus TaxID=568069 RepID=A0A1J1J1E4_9DIPT|nr:CLUMA_CG018462, isoform A [Clunio marinus]